MVEISPAILPPLAWAAADQRSCRGIMPEGMPMSRLMIVVEFEVKPEHRNGSASSTSSRCARRAVASEVTR
jgi:hypothetical protein